MLYPTLTPFPSFAGVSRGGPLLHGMISVEVSTEVLASKDWGHTSLLPLAIERGISDRDYDEIHKDVRFIKKERIL